jgi:hypothetical protein
MQARTLRQLFCTTFILKVIDNSKSGGMVIQFLAQYSMERPRSEPNVSWRDIRDESVSERLPSHDERNQVEGSKYSNNR